jgi:creatinine amidohydrolase
LNPTTLYQVVKDLVDSLQRQGLRKLVLLNGHGGNELKPVMRELYDRCGVFICLCDWYRMVADLYPQIFVQASEHADEMETSLGLAFFPEFVHPELADSGATNPTRFEAINRKWISITRPWHLATTNAGLGDPAPATAEKGRLLMEGIVERLSKFLIELSNTPIDDKFPY